MIGPSTSSGHSTLVLSEEAKTGMVEDHERVRSETEDESNGGGGRNRTDVQTDTTYTSTLIVHSRYTSDIENKQKTSRVSDFGYLMTLTSEKLEKSRRDLIRATSVSYINSKFVAGQSALPPEGERQHISQWVTMRKLE